MEWGPGRQPTLELLLERMAEITPDRPAGSDGEVLMIFAVKINHFCALNFGVSMRAIERISP